MTDDTTNVENVDNLDGSTETPVEKQSFSQDDFVHKKTVNDIVKRNRLEAYHKGKQDALKEREANPIRDVSHQGSVKHESPSLGLGGVAPVNPQEIQKMIADAARELHEKRQKEEMEEKQSQAAYAIAQRFNSGLAQGKLKYPDFDDKVKDLDFAGMSPIVHLATETGMPEDIMYDLAENPQKITHLMILAHSQPALAKREMDKLAASIKMNEAAKKQAQPKEPLSQITPSNASSDSGEMSVKDFQKMFSGMAY